LNLGHNVEIGYYAQDQSESLDTKLTLLETMENASPPEMRTRLRNILGSFLFSGEDVDKKVSVLSGGERARLALACMLLRPFNLLVLDEPTNHLDITSKDVLKQALQKYDGTMVIVSHDRDFLADLTNRTIEFRDQKLYNHIGDVNAFLEKRALDNMRQVELSKPANNLNETTASSSGKLKADFNLRKQLTKAVNGAEKKIEKLEERISTWERKMADPSFYESPNAQADMRKYDETKNKLELALEEWEKAQTEMDKYEI
jgi:ATP-binding cassette subfamily F protein 3